MAAKEQANEIFLLQKIGKAGSKSAGSALTAMLKKKVDSSVPDIQVLPAKSIDRMFEKSGPQTGVVLNLAGDVSGALALLFGRQDALGMIDALSGNKEGSTRFVGEYNQSVLKEVGNIVCNAYLNALCATFRLTVRTEPPQLIYNLSQPFSGLLGPAAENVQEVIMIETSFEVEGVRSHGKILFLFDEKSFDRLMSKV